MFERSPRILQVELAKALTGLQRGCFELCDLVVSEKVLMGFHCFRYFGYAFLGGKGVEWGVRSSGERASEL